ncbi:MAG TPA: hypothetical protein DCR43_01470 [Bacteroidales bacterium]|nr:MAG: hypothetical protein A2X11_10785 [Bacteroidetes bacterium GWE2_42_24]OFY28161.1 MAG: hypothetical protein A2X09_01040 [Bacteroidetes bacterium GWF2_43_11]HAQ64519.1 hypothetical protein [Bacteroidales bacterium]HBZ65544.1 hypothetical protein [Bacteroidales bacterium]
MKNLVMCILSIIKQLQASSAMTGKRLRAVIITLLICISFTSFANAPSTADSLRRQLSKVKGEEHVRTQSALAEFYMYSDGREALAYAKEAYLEAAGMNNTTLMMRSLTQEGLAWSNLGSYDTSISILRKALSIKPRDKNPGDLGKLYSVLGIAYEGAGISDSALKYYHEAFRVYSLAKDDQGIVNTYLNLGCLFMRLKKFDEAGINLNRALNESFSRKAVKALGSIYNNLGVVEDVRGNKEKSLGYYTKALKYQQAVGNIGGMAAIYHNVAIIHFDLNEYGQALDNFKKSIALKYETGNREGIATTYSSMAEVYLKIDQIQDAEAYVIKALEIAAEGRYLVVEVQAFKQLAVIYERQGRYKEASAQWAKALIFSDSLYNQSVSRQLSEMQGRYELRHKDQENQILRQEKNQQRTNNHFLVFAIIAISIVLILLFILLRMKVLSMRKTKELFELEIAKRANDYRLLEIEKREEEMRQLYLVQKYKSEEEIRALELSNLNTSVMLKNRELTTLTANFINKNEILGQIKKELVNIQRQATEKPANDITELIKVINSNLDKDLNWKKFKISLEESHTGFLERLIKAVPDLTLNEQKLCAYLFVGLSSNEIAQVMNITLAAVNKGRQRMRKRLQLPVNGDISAFLNAL